MKSLKAKIKNTEPVIGSWITLNSPEVAEVMGQFPFDWLTIDMEHSAITLSQAQQMVRAIQAAGIPVLVRVGENNANLIKQVMDTGADGVIVPMIKSKEEAQKAVAAAKYPPQGNRGVGLARAQGYGFKFNAYKEWLLKEGVVIVIIEHKDAMKDLEGILSVEGVDASMIGPYDLSGSLGHPGDFERKEMIELTARYLNVCQKLKKPAGYHIIAPDAGQLNKKISEGFRFLAFSTDTLFLGTYIGKQFKQVKKSEYVAFGRA